jgi:hypothetical protein
MEASILKDRWNNYDPTARTSMRTWVRVIRTYEDIPVGFQEAFPKPIEDFPYVLLLPPENDSIFNSRPAQLVCLYSDYLLVLEARYTKVIETRFSFDAITQVEHGSVLLNSWLTLTQPGATVKLRYNAVSDELMKPVLQRLRYGVSKEQESQADTYRYQEERAKFDFLGAIYFKFMTFGANSLLPNATVKKLIYQPEVLVKTEKIVDRFGFQRYQTANLIILTDQELTVISESKPYRYHREALYGAVLTHFPRRHIRVIDIEPSPYGQSKVLTIILSDERITKFPLTNPEFDIGSFQPKEGSDVG